MKDRHGNTAKIGDLVRVVDCTKTSMYCLTTSYRTFLACSTTFIPSTIFLK